MGKGFARRLRRPACAGAALMLLACAPDFPARAPDVSPQAAPDSDGPSARLLRELDRVRAAMRGICRKQCGSVVLLADTTLTSGAATRASVQGHASFLLYHPDARNCAQNPDATLRFYCVAHEYGHHLDVTMNPEWSPDPWTQEIRADALAGCAFARADVPTGAIESALVRAVLLDDADARSRADACGSDDAHPSLRFSWDALKRGAQACRDGATTHLEIADAVAPLVLSAKASAGAAQAFRAQHGLDCSPPRPERR